MLRGQEKLLKENSNVYTQQGLLFPSQTFMKKPCGVHYDTKEPYDNSI